MISVSVKWKLQRKTLHADVHARMMLSMNNEDISPCCIWSHKLPVDSSATEKQKPCWVAPKKTRSPWESRGACLLQNHAGSAGASNHAAAEVWTPAPEGHKPPTDGCTTAGNVLMNKKRGCVCVVPDTSPAMERDGMTIKSLLNVPDQLKATYSLCTCDVQNLVCKH